MKKIASSVILSLLAIGSIIPNAQTNAQDSQEINAQIVNISSYELSTDAGNRKNIKAVIKNSETKNPKKSLNEANILVLDKDKSFHNSKLEEYNLVVGLEEVNASDADLKLKWTGLNKKGSPVSGEVVIDVDYDNFSDDHKMEYTEKSAKDAQVVEAIKDALDLVNSNTDQVLISTASDSSEYNWTNVESSQQAGYFAPYGKIRMNYNVKKAHIANGTQDHFFSSHLNTQINPGAQLCSSDTTYECKYKTETSNLRIMPKTSDNIPFSMIEHAPVNQGSSGSIGYSIGAGYDGKDISLNAAYNWSQNWTELNLVDNSDSWGNWDYTFSGDLKSQVQTVTAGSVFITNDQYMGHLVNNYAFVTFDSWNTFPVDRVVNNSIWAVWY